MNILNGIKNVLSFINENWTAIVIISGLLLAVYKKINNYIKLSDEEKINIAKKQIKEIMLKLVTDAEIDYAEWVKSGSVKRAEVINKIFNLYPILSEVTNQEDLIKWIDNTIDEALVIMKEMIEKNITLNFDCIDGFEDK